MKRNVLYSLLSFLLLSCSTTIIHAQSPGGVGTTNLTAWFSPDALPLGNATSWTTVYPTGAAAITMTDAVTPFPIATNTPTGNSSNYNTTIDFAGNGTGTNGAARALEFIGTLNLLDNRISTSQGTFFAAYYVNDNGSGGQHIVDYRESTGDAIQFRYLSAATTRLALGTSGSSTNACRNFADDSKPMVFSYSGNRGGATNLKARRRSLDITTASASQAGTGGRIGILVGARKNGAGNYLGAHRSFISELIFFNTDLSFTDNIKVESYLAIKYGVTLEATATSGGAYVSSNISIPTWLTNVPYHNDVIGIGRDDISTLQQKQSHSFDDSIRIYLGTLSNNNVANTATFTNDISYAVMGHNTGANNETAAATAEMPSGVNLINRIEREWCIKNTNLSNTFSLDIKLDNFTNFSNIASDIVLLVDDDGNFSNATVFQTGLNFSVNGNTVTVSGISNSNIPLDGTRYITLATRMISAPVTLTSFSAKAANQKININWESAVEENFSHYTVEHSINSNDWKEIGTLYGQGNESSYTLHHNNPALGINYYRLKMIDIDNTYKYSDIRQVKISNEEQVKIYPNPIVNNFVWIEGGKKALLKITMTNALGQELKQSMPAVTYLSDNLIRIDMSALSEGIYFVKAGEKSYSIIK